MVEHFPSFALFPGRLLRWWPVRLSQQRLNGKPQVRVVYLHRIYTKTGDAGETALGNGQRLPKTDLRIRAYGGVDELNSFLGMARANGLSEEVSERVFQIQNDLFDLGADLCVPESDEAASPALRMTEAQVFRLEQWIDAATSILLPLKSFILPGGSQGAAALHVARAVCRRVELDVLELAQRDRLNPQALIYLNRLSDLLFVWARLANDRGATDVLWVPGQNR